MLAYYINHHRTTEREAETQLSRFSFIHKFEDLLSAVMLLQEADSQIINEYLYFVTGIEIKHMRSKNEGGY